MFDELNLFILLLIIYLKFGDFFIWFCIWQIFIYEKKNKRVKIFN